MGAAAALAAAVLAVLGWGLAHPQASALSGRPATVTIELLDGSSLDLAAYRGRPVVVNFWASWCADCHREQGALEAASRSHPEVAFVGILYGDTPAAARSYESATHAYGYPLGYSDGAARAFGAEAVPTTFFLDRSGLVMGEVAGPVSAARLTQLLAEIER